AAKFEQGRLKAVVEQAQLIMPGSDSDPQDPRPARIREATRFLHAHGEGRMFLGLLGYHPADAGDLAIVHLAEEKKSDVQVFGLDPFDGAASEGQRLLQGDGAIADRLADVHADEGAKSGHASLPKR